MKLLTVQAVLAMAACLSACDKPLPDVEPLTGGSPRTGQQLIERYGCAACHRIKGIAHADSDVGPSLTSIRQAGYVGGVLPNSADNLARWIMDPRDVNPRTAMPDLDVTRDEARDIAAYLYSQ